MPAPVAGIRVMDPALRDFVLGLGDAPAGVGPANVPQNVTLSPDFGTATLVFEPAIPATNLSAVWSSSPKVA